MSPLCCTDTIGAGSSAVQVAEQELRDQAAQTYSLLFDDPLPTFSSTEQWIAWAEK